MNKITPVDSGEKNYTIYRTLRSSAMSLQVNVKMSMWTYEQHDRGSPLLLRKPLGSKASILDTQP